ncbi:MAG: GIY-YIG nuclease family protein [Saprospiraceae bacterium]
MVFIVYILYSPTSDYYYIGHTNNLKQRVQRHNSGVENFTSKYIPWNLIWYGEKNTKSEAYKLEQKLKNLSKKRILEFINKYELRESNADDPQIDLDNN